MSGQNRGTTTAISRNENTHLRVARGGEPAHADGGDEPVAVITVRCPDPKGFAPVAGRCLRRFYGEWWGTQLSPHARLVAFPLPVQFRSLRRKRDRVVIDLAYRPGDDELTRRELRKALEDRVLQAFLQPDGGIDGFAFGPIDAVLTPPWTPEEEAEDAETEGLSDDGFDYGGAQCRRCEREINRNGYCTNPRCPYAECRQDEPVPASAWERERLVGNRRSRRAYPFGTAGYGRNLGSPSAVSFSDEAGAVNAGYEVRHDGLRAAGR